MAEISSNTGGVDDIVEGELVDERAVLQEQRKRLSGMSMVARNLRDDENRPDRYHRQLRERLLTVSKSSLQAPGKRKLTSLDHFDDLRM